MRADGTPSGPDVPRRAGSVLAALERGLRDVGRLVLPVECPGCGRWDEVLCDTCARVLVGPVVRCEDDVPRLDRMDGSPPLPVWRVTPYAGPARGLVVAWKDRGRADLTPVLLEALGRAATRIAPLLATVAQGRPLVVVPVPAGPGARRRRGADLVGLLAGAAAEALTGAGVPATSRDLLVGAHRWRRPDQVGLGARARRVNTAGSVRLRARADAGPRGALHLLVDDVVTTGSTLAACEEALSAGGHAVVGAVVLAATPAPAQARRRLLVRAEED